MSRLIDADALMEASKYEFWQDGSAITPIGEYILGKFRQLIRNMPTIEPERKKGRWIEHNPHKWGLGIVFECSECGEKIDCEQSNYCPNCGAEMEGQDDSI